MGGKSTYLRQSALIVLMAQMGSFVPPRAKPGSPSRTAIFTRIGASDNLARGRSTFLVEMSEVAAILNHATPASLVSARRSRPRHPPRSMASPSPGPSSSTCKSTPVRARSSPTHYHELTELAELLPTVKNVHVSVKETPSEIIFLRRVEPGSADKSYGIEVAPPCRTSAQRDRACPRGSEKNTSKASTNSARRSPPRRRSRTQKRQPASPVHRPGPRSA